MDQLSGYMCMAVGPNLLEVIVHFGPDNMSLHGEMSAGLWFEKRWNKTASHCQRTIETERSIPRLY